MISITNMSDIDNLRDNSNVPEILTEYLGYVLEDLLARYKVKDISKFGKLLLLDITSEHKEHTKLGLAKPLEASLYEYSECIKISSSYEDISILHGCFLLSNEYFLSIYSEPDYLTQQECLHLLEEAGEIEFNI